jgi:hypothetical protein
MAYDTNREESRNIYRIRMTDLFLKATGTRAELEDLASIYYPDQIAEWQKKAPVAPAAEPAQKTSYFSSVSSFFSCKKSAVATQDPQVDATLSIATAMSM